MNLNAMTDGVSRGLGARRDDGGYRIRGLGCVARASKPVGEMKKRRSLASEASRRNGLTISP